MKWPKLTHEEKAIEAAALRGEYVDVSTEEFKRIVAIVKNSRKNAILHIRINENDLNLLKRKAKKHGVKYQSFIAEVLHKVARS